MTANDERPTTGHDTMKPGVLGAWWREGLRSALLMRPRWSGLQTTPSVIAILVGVAFLLEVGIQRLYIEDAAFFYWPALQAGWLSTVVSVWWCWLLVPPPAGAERPADQPPSAAALFSMLAAQALPIGAVTGLVVVPLLHAGALSEQTLGRWGLFAVWWAPLVWVASLRLIWGSGARVAARVAAASAMVGAMTLAVWHEPTRWWYPQTSGPDAAEPFALTQEIAERQTRLVAERLDGLRPQRPGVIDVYTITFAPYADEDVFRLESERVASVMEERFDAAGHALQLVNHRATVADRPWATPLNLQRAIERVASLMDREEDVLFIHLTSHGARDGELAVQFAPLAIAPVTPADLKAWLDGAGVRWRIVSVSACYSGSWIAPLADPGTLVMSAADAEHTSYGCGRNSALTYFGRAMFDEQLRHTWSFERAHAAARRVIEQREREAGKSDGYSNPQIATGAEIRARLAALEAQRARAASGH